jgi:hypothetical protein
MSWDSFPVTVTFESEDVVKHDETDIDLINYILHVIHVLVENHMIYSGALETFCEMNMASLTPEHCQ